MPPLLFEEPMGGPLAEKRANELHEPRQDRRLNVLKIGALSVFAAVLVGVVLLVTTGGGDDGAENASSPPVPTIDSPHSDGSAGASTSTSPRPPAAMAGAATTHLVVTTTTAPPQQQPLPTTQPSEPGFKYAVIGQPCPRQGDYSMTEDGEFAMCRGNGGGQLVWQRIG